MNLEVVDKVDLGKQRHCQANKDVESVSKLWEGDRCYQASTYDKVNKRIIQ